MQPREGRAGRRRGRSDARGECAERAGGIHLAWRGQRHGQQAAAPRMRAGRAATPVCAPPAGSPASRSCRSSDERLPTLSSASRFLEGQGAAVVAHVCGTGGACAYSRCHAFIPPVAPFPQSLPAAPQIMGVAAPPARVRQGRRSAHPPSPPPHTPTHHHHPPTYPLTAHPMPKQLRGRKRVYKALV